jgi:hypothetical protein
LVWLVAIGFNILCAAFNMHCAIEHGKAARRYYEGMKHWSGRAIEMLALLDQAKAEGSIQGNVADRMGRALRGE